MKTYKLLFASVALIIFAALSCSDSNGSGNALVRFSFDLSDAPGAAKLSALQTTRKVRAALIKVTGPEMTPVNRRFATNEEVLMIVPAGEKRTFTGELYELEVIDGVQDIVDTTIGDNLGDGQILDGGLGERLTDLDKLRAELGTLVYSGTTVVPSLEEGDIIDVTINMFQAYRADDERIDYLFDFEPPEGTDIAPVGDDDDDDDNDDDSTGVVTVKQADRLFADLGDRWPADIDTFDVVVDDANLRFITTFYSEGMKFQPNRVIDYNGVIEIDLDSITGVQGTSNSLVDRVRTDNNVTGINADFRIDIFRSEEAYLTSLQAGATGADKLQVVRTNDSIEVIAPLSLMNLTGAQTYKVAAVFGNNMGDPSDIVPNSGALSFTATPVVITTAAPAQ